MSKLFSTTERENSIEPIVHIEPIAYPAYHVIPIDQVERIKKGKVIYDSKGNIKVGCTVIDFKAISKIYHRALAARKSRK